ncbi:unnamed protein product [Adineta steineri]|uniref:General transcription factor TFIIB n=1 Tax=Adineta steineri TaxID=433720 RepID=A0A814XFY2_9BILA|nr:unnamed protein product [Adineta steineri]CAF1489916.1 unnamed protein product [Adineta steineri]
MSRYVKQLVCRFHPEATLIEDYRAGDMICPECGLVVGDRMIDVSAEWRTFSNDSDTKDMSRVGAASNPLFSTDHFHTFMTSGTGAGALDESGKQKYTNKSSQVSSEDKALKTGFDAIRQMAGRISLSTRIIDRACLIYKQCYENKCVRGRSPDAVAAACIYLGCRHEGLQRTIKEICAIATNATKVEIGRCFQQIIKKLPNVNRPETVDIKNLIPRFCSRLQLEEVNLIRKTAIYIVEQAKELCDIQSRAPDSVAGAAIYMACAAVNDRQPLKDIATATGASENTIRQVYRIMLPRAAKLFSADFVFKCPLVNLPKS